MPDRSTLDKTGVAERTVLSRLFVMLMVVFVAIPSGVLLVASKTIRHHNDTTFPHLFFNDTLHRKA
jgi:hypothetical protein